MGKCKNILNHQKEPKDHPKYTGNIREDPQEKQKEHRKRKQKPTNPLQPPKKNLIYNPTNTKNLSTILAHQRYTNYPKIRDYKEDPLHSNDKNIHIVENKPIPFMPNSLKNAKGATIQALLRSFTHKRTLPGEESLPNSEMENPNNPKND